MAFAIVIQYFVRKNMIIALLALIFIIQKVITVLKNILSENPVYYLSLQLYL